MRARATILTITAALTLGSGCGQQAARAKKETGNPDQYFLVQAAIINESEIAASRLAAERAASPRVKQFAQHMITDHTAANNELKQLAKRKDVNLVERPDEAHVMTAAHLSELTGEQFDREYIAEMVADHAKAVSLFTSRARVATDPEIRAFAERMAPQLEEHLRMAQALDKTSSGTSAGSASPGAHGGSH
ncbi:MAG TPA: DUF4142 domain-containing protein [Planctomycetota bacterium]|nr:DUF4142 domain-containing protein [Planctomycetota bacterium]